LYCTSHFQTEKMRSRRRRRGSKTWSRTFLHIPWIKK
jgi:hypothetical protein